MTEDIFFYKNNTVTIDVTITDGNGDPIDLTGGKLYFTMKNSFNEDDSEAAIQKSVTSHTDPTNGQSRITLSKDDTDVPPKKYLYDITFIASTGEKYTDSDGNCEVRDIVTRATS